MLEVSFSAFDPRAQVLAVRNTHRNVAPFRALTHLDQELKPVNLRHQQVSTLRRDGFRQMLQREAPFDRSLDCHSHARARAARSPRMISSGPPAGPLSAIGLLMSAAGLRAVAVDRLVMDSVAAEREPRAAVVQMVTSTTGSRKMRIDLSAASTVQQSRSGILMSSVIATGAVARQ